MQGDIVNKQAAKNKQGSDKTTKISTDNQVKINQAPVDVVKQAPTPGKLEESSVASDSGSNNQVAVKQGSSVGLAILTAIVICSVLVTLLILSQLGVIS